MNNPVQEFVRPLVDTSIRMVTNTLSSSRDLAVNGAHLVAKGRKPLHLVTESGLRLNTISHKSIARLMNVQAEMIEGTLVGTAKRLETAAKAHSVRELLNEQVALIPATRERLTGDARKMMDVITDTGGDIKELVSGTVSALSDSGKTAAKTTRRVTKKASNAAKRATAKTRKTATKAKATTTRTKKKVARKVSKATK